MSISGITPAGDQANPYVGLMQQYVGVDPRRSDLAGSLPVPDRDINLIDPERARSELNYDRILLSTSPSILVFTKRRINCVKRAFFAGFCAI